MFDRRTMIKGAGAALGMAMSARSYAQIKGANDRLRVAVVGVNGRGQAHMSAFTKLPNVAVTHLVDVDSRVLAKRAGEFAARGHAAPQTESDYRRLLDRKSVDIVTVATPDHWHAKLAIDAMDAGRDVYLEKPIGMAPAEGEALIAVQQRTRRLLQVGNQQRSSKETRALAELVRAGLLGDVYEAQTWYANNRISIGRGQEVPPPAHLDWNMWQGPRPRGPYRSNLVPYNWHWFWKYGTGETCNNAMHELDVARWLMGLAYPKTVSARGSRRFYRGDDWEMYDTLALDLVYADGRTIRWDGNSCNAMPRYGRGRGVLFLGTRGSAIVDRNGFELFDLAGKQIRQVAAPASSETTGTVGEGALDVYHAGNFVDVIRGRASALASPIREGHISTTLCHLGNIAYRTGTTLTLDEATGRPSSPEAMKLWSVDYEPGWEVKA
ncbi:Gfo/Idh/MocA family protein [Allosphingosinicella deserti]|uniref:Gfo/Idh/MocA family oxidoreductase n=1 Tax=Allosphingosinicella deserti TaxID=2116704 RepID=A0A2P7QM52_9SPHN|nr:Gfo/Idh/MocA family oxidoreductase [Sphingomonas deserti]PSJ39048.1 gfo/Idh/MocA family oxidoreductase [Sphingomonas deserti]